MPRLLALEWDSREVRVAVATPRAGEALIEDAFAVALPARGEGDDAVQSTGDAIAAALTEHRVGRVVALAAVGRAGIELKPLSLPPAPDDELPDLVRFQSLREFHSIGEDWPLDYIPMAGPAGAPRKVLAAAVSPDLVNQIRQTCQRAKISPERLVLRSCAAASLLARAQWESVARVKLLVDLLADEADLTVLVEDEVVFLRTVRLPGELESESGTAALVGEVRRTVAAARNQVGGLTIEAIYLCGGGAEHRALATLIETQVGIATHGFDPFAGLSLSGTLQRNLPATPSRFAPVLGMLLDEAEQVRHTVDFLNPHRRPPPPSRRRQLIWAATAACVVFAAGFSWLQSSLTALDDEIAVLRDKSKSLDKLVDRAKETERAAQEVGAWADNDVNWLDELRELSLDMPPARDVLLTRLNMGANNAVPTAMPGSFASQMDLEGLLRGAETASQLEAALRDEFHTVQGPSLQQDSSRDGYSWKFTSIIAAKPETRESYQKHAEAAEAKRAAAGPDSTTGRPRFGGSGEGGFGGPWEGFGGQGWQDFPGGGSPPPAKGDSGAPAKTENSPPAKGDNVTPNTDAAAPKESGSGT